MRSTTRESAHRAANNVARVTLTKADDAPKAQEVAVEILAGEKKTGLERFQNYGFTSVPKSETGTGVEAQAAEGIVVFIGGNRSHGVIVAMDDRRYRLKDLKEGESAQYDDQGQKVHITRGGIMVDAGDKKLPITVKCGNATFTVKDGEIKGVVNDTNYVLVKDKEVQAVVNKTAVYVEDGRIDLGKKGAPHKVLTEDGPSEKVYAVIDEDGP